MLTSVKCQRHVDLENFTVVSSWIVGRAGYSSTEPSRALGIAGGLLRIYRRPCPVFEQYHEQYHVNCETVRLNFGWRFVAFSYIADYSAFLQGHLLVYAMDYLRPSNQSSFAVRRRVLTDEEL